MAHMDSIGIILPHSLLRASKKLYGADRVCGGSYGCPCMYAGVCLHILYIYIQIHICITMCVCVRVCIYTYMYGNQMSSTTSKVTS